MPCCWRRPCPARRSRRARCSTSAPASASWGWPWRGALRMRAVTLVERDPRLAALARSNIERNGLADRARLIEADVARPLERTRRARPGCRDLRSRARQSALPYRRARHRGARSPQGRRQRHAGRRPRPLGALHGGAWRARAAPPPSSTVPMRCTRFSRRCAGRFGGAVVLPIHPREGEPLPGCSCRASRAAARRWSSGLA